MLEWRRWRNQLVVAAWVSGILLTSTSPVPSRAQQQLGWEPRKTWVFVVGLLEWQDKKNFDSFPQEKRRDAELVELFRTAGVPEAHVIYLKDAAATTLAINERLLSVLARAGPDDLLVLYYCGHGYKSDDGEQTFFASYDAGVHKHPGWSVNSILDTIDQHFGGSRALLMADCCYSGALVEAASGRHGRVSYAALSSSSASELSTENWTFTECLLDGFRGKPFVDFNDDHSVTIAELARHATLDMSSAEGQAASFGVTGRFSPETLLSLSAAKADPRVGDRVEVEVDGEPHRARVLQVDQARFFVHPIGLDEQNDEWVDQSQTRAYRPEPHEIGDRVEVQWEKKWYAAHVLQTRDGVYRIHYDDYEDVWDEWVSPQRIRKPKH